MAFRRFVALGDSVTEGVGDPLVGGSLRGWADRLAEALRAAESDLVYVNLAVRSLTTRAIKETQLEAALSHEPDLASAVVGMNDAINEDYDITRFERDLEDIVSSLTKIGTTVLTSGLPDVSRSMPMPRAQRDELSKRLQEISTSAREIGHSYGTVHVEADQMREEWNPQNRSLDRLHPNSRGHLLIARTFAERLSQRTGELIEMPALEPWSFWGKETYRHARWLVGEGAIPGVARHVGRSVHQVVTTRLRRTRV